MSQPAPKKKAYTAPTLTNLGNVKDLTKGSPLVATPDVVAISK